MTTEVFDVLDPADPRPAARRALRAWLGLHAVFARRPADAAQLLEQTADPIRALRSCGRVPPPDFAADTAIEALRGCGAVAVPLRSPAYPARLARLPDPPPLLFVRGSVDALAAPAVAIVGARAATAYGLAVARELALELTRAGLVIVSGLARGIDAASHRSALEAGGLTVGVQGCGPDRVYPSSHRALADRVAARGAVLSELPPGAPPLPQHFPFRNRIISALARAVVVVEARENSGSLITARHALDQGIEVLAVPGPILAATSRGPNRLLRDGAAPVLEARDVLEAIGHRVPDSAARPPRRAPDTPRSRAILRALGVEPCTRDELARRLRLAPEELATAVVALELEGRVVEDRDGRLMRIGS